MDIDELLGIDLTKPSDRLARLLTEEDESLVDRLVELRKRKNLSQQDVAEKMGVSQSAVARIESGERDPRMSTLRRYAHAIGVLVTHSADYYRHALPTADSIESARRSIPDHVKEFLPPSLRAVLA